MEALKALPEVAAELGTDPAVVQRMREEYETHLQILRAGGGEADDGQVLRHDQHHTALRLALLDRKRATVLRLRNEHVIVDTVLRHLDIEEVRFSRRQAE